MEEDEELDIEEDQESEQEEIKEDSKKDTKKVIIAIGIIIVLFAVFLSYWWFSNQAPDTMTLDQLHEQNIEGKETDKNYMYNGFSFVFNEGLWYTQVQKDNNLFDVPLHYGPKDLEDIEIIGIINPEFYKGPVYISFNPKGKYLQYIALSSAELSLNLVKGINVTPIAACDRNETEACKDRPIITCEDDLLTIYMQESDTTEVKIKGNCIEVKGNEKDLVRATDRLILKLYNVMN